MVQWRPSEQAPPVGVRSHRPPTQALVKQGFLLSQSLEIMDDLAMIVDPEGRITYANPAAKRRLDDYRGP